ncbi:MAG: S41 family peptidase [Oscillospiraceae bacterium]
MFKFKKKKEQVNQIELTAMHAQEVIKENKNQLKDECAGLPELNKTASVVAESFKTKMSKKIKLKTAIILILVAVFLVEGSHLFYYFKDRDFYKFIDELRTINHIIDKNYIYKIDKEYMYTNACKSFVNSLGDKHSSLVSKKELNSLDLGITEMFGTGCKIRMLEFADRPGEYYFQITDVQKDSPLEKAGFLPGDEILRVNNFVSSAYYNKVYYNNENTDYDIVPVKTDKEHSICFLAGLGDFTLVDENTEYNILCNSNLENMYGLLDMLSQKQKRDVLDRSVYIEYVRFNPETERNDIYCETVQKNKLKANSVSYKVLKEQNIGYLKLSSFKINSGQEFIQALNALLEAGVDGIVLDLRGNHGGSVDEYNKIITQLIKKGPLYHFEGCDFKECISATGKNFKTDINIAVLVNKESASASEMLAANMKTHNRGLVIGERTYGKGVGQGVFWLKNGDCLFLVDKFWYAMPGKLDIDQTGVEPDICVESTNLNDDNFAVYGYDIPLTEAVDYLTKKVEQKGSEQTDKQKNKTEKS